MILNFRTLKASEIDVKPQTVKETGFSLLLYKNARVDMELLDEVVGPLNWQRKHNRDNANCIVSIYDEDKKVWVEKEDTGTESFTEKEKGLASDSFKRACFNWGIGRELYSAPFIWINESKYITKSNNGKLGLNSKFYIKSIEYENRNIIHLEVVDSKNNLVFKYEKELSEKEKKEKAIKMITEILADKDDGIINGVLNKYKKNSLKDCTNEELKKIYMELI
ncbi:putative Rad52/22 family double-strand break repair protein [Fusobacterium phage vB_FnuS_FNU4]|nr:putative Rad52/22 family double-strand break repair protein [Fusobacterium phage vB_FnuS_FNU4]